MTESSSVVAKGPASSGDGLQRDTKEWGRGGKLEVFYDCYFCVVAGTQQYICQKSPISTKSVNSFSCKGHLNETDFLGGQ